MDQYIPIENIVITHISPLQDTYNPTTGMTNFTCHVESSTDITKTKITINKYYGGWEVTKIYDSQTQIHQGNNDKIFYFTFSTNLTNGFYTYKCEATDSFRRTNETIDNANWKYKTGKGIVYIQHAIHAEPDNLTSNILNSTFDFSDFDQGGTIDRAMLESHRLEYTDSFGRPNTYIWKLRMDEPTCMSSLGCTATLDEFLYDDWNYTQDYQRWNDGLGWHYHHMDWYDWSQYKENNYICPEEGCQPAEYWNQILTMNGTIYRNQSDIEMTEKILSELIIDYDFYALTSARGWIGVTTEISNWLSNYIPFNFDNWYGKYGRDPDEILQPVGNIYDWTRTPKVMYNPSNEDYQVPGNNNNFILPCMPGGLNDNDEQKKYARDTFALADQGTDIILCHYSHSYQTYPYFDMRHDVISLHNQLESDRNACWTVAYQGICMDELFPEVKFAYLNDQQMMQEILEITDNTPPIINATKINNLLVVESDEELWTDFPKIAYKDNFGKYFMVQNTDIIKLNNKKWKVDLGDFNIVEIKVVGIDKSYNIGFSTIIKKETCGSLNNDDVVDITDIVYLVDYLFNQGPVPTPGLCVADVDASGRVNNDDLTYLKNYMFNQGPAPEENCCEY